MIYHEGMKHHFRFLIGTFFLFIALKGFSNVPIPGQSYKGFPIQRVLEPGEVFKYRIMYEVMRKSPTGAMELMGMEQGKLDELINIGQGGKGFEITYAYYPQSINVTNQNMEFVSIPIQSSKAKNSSVVDLDSNLMFEKIVSSGNVFAYLINSINEGLGNKTLPIDVPAMIAKAPSSYYKQTASELKIPAALQKWTTKIPAGFPEGKVGSKPSRSLTVTYLVKEFEVRYGVPILIVDWNAEKGTLGKLLGLNLSVASQLSGSLNMSRDQHRTLYDGGMYNVPELLPGFQLTEELQKNKAKNVFALFKFLPNKTPSFYVRLTINREAMNASKG